MSRFRQKILSLPLVEGVPVRRAPLDLVSRYRDIQHISYAEAIGYTRRVLSALTRAKAIKVDFLDYPSLPVASRILIYRCRFSTGSYAGQWAGQAEGATKQGTRRAACGMPGVPLSPASEGIVSWWSPLHTCIISSEKTIMPSGIY